MVWLILGSMKMPTPKKTVKIDEDAHTKIKVKASRERVTFQVMLARIITEGLKSA